MYEYVDDKIDLSEAEEFCKGILQDLVNRLSDEGMYTQIILVGSGARDLIMRNGNGSIDFDYNLNIQNPDDWPDGKELKETVRNQFNDVLKDYKMKNCRDSTSVLTTRPFPFKKLKMDLSIDVCIVKKVPGKSWCRLIHKKGKDASEGSYMWNEMKHSSNIKDKVNDLKQNGMWEEVRVKYRDLKNKYLTRGDHNHPSFVCYKAAVNDVHNSMIQQRNKAKTTKDIKVTR